MICTQVKTVLPIDLLSSLGGSRNYFAYKSVLSVTQSVELTKDKFQQNTVPIPLLKIFRRLLWEVVGIQ